MVGGLTLSVASHVIAYRLKHLWHGIAYLPSRHRHGKQCVPRRSTSSHTHWHTRRQTHARVERKGSRLKKNQKLGGWTADRQQRRYI